MNIFSLENKNDDYSLKIGITFHKYVFILKALLIFLNLKGTNDTIEGIDRNYLVVKIFILCIINISNLLGFLWALLNKSLICYQTTFVISLELFVFETVYLIQVILLLKKITNICAFGCNIIYFLLSIFEIIFIKLFVYYVGVSSIQRFTSFTADYSILQLIRIRTRVVVLRIFIISYIIMSFMIFWFTHTVDMGENKEVYVFLKPSLLSDIFFLLLNIFVIAVFFILSIDLDKENLKQRIILLILISIIVISDFIVGTFQTVKYWNVGDYSLFYHFFRGLFFVYAFFVILQDYRSCGKGLKEFLEKINRRSFNKI